MFSKKTTSCSWAVAGGVPAGVSPATRLPSGDSVGELPPSLAIQTLGFSFSNVSPFMA